MDTTTLPFPDELLVPEKCETLSPDRLEQARSAFALKMRGQTQDQIATELGVSRSTVVRLLDDYRKLYSEQLSNEPRVHLLAVELAKLDDIESTARKEAETATSNRDKQAFLKIALQAIDSRQSLLLETGVIPREPSKLISVTCSVADDLKKEERTMDELRADVEKLLRTGRRL